VPVAAIVSQEFAGMAEASARDHGYDGLPLVTVEQPFDRLTEERVSEIAKEIADDVIYILSTPAERLQAEFSNRWQTSQGREIGYTTACAVPRPDAPE